MTRWHIIKVLLIVAYRVVVKRDYIGLLLGLLPKEDPPATEPMKHHHSAMGFVPELRKMVRGGGQHLLVVLILAGVAMAAGQITVTGYPPVPVTIKGGTGINITGGVITATGTAVVEGSIPFANISSAGNDAYLAKTGTAINSLAYQGNSAPSATEFSYIDGVTAPIQGQISSVKVTAESKPNASNVTPTMNGIAAAGSAPTVSRADHIHPSDASREPANANIQSHISSTGNPHIVTKAQVGLGNVDNTSDLSKPISTATQSALNLKANTSSLATVATTGSYTDLLNKPATYSLPTASTTVLGGVKVDGTSVVIDGAGVISSTVSAGVSSVDGATGAVLLTGVYKSIAAFNIYSTAQGAKDAAQDAAIAGKEPADSAIIKESELSSATNSTSTTTAANSAAVKAAYDLAAGKLPVNAPSSTGLAQIGGAPMYPDDGEIKDATYGYAYNLKSGSGTSASPSTGAQAAFYVEKYAGYNGLTSDLSRGAAHFRTIKKTGATNMSGLMSSFSLNGGTGDSSNLFLHSVLRSPLAASPAGSFYGAWNYVRNQAGAGSGHMANVEFDMGEDATTNDAGHYQDHLTWAGPNKNFSSHIWGSVITTQNVTMGMGLLGGKGYGKYHTGWYTDTDTIVPTAGGRNEVFFPRGGTTAGNAYTIMRAGPDYYTDGIDLSAATLSGSAIKLAPSQTISDGTVTKTLAQLAAGGTGLTDGDKGDITVTGSGATWTIDANSVALGTDTTGDYVSGATTGGGLAKTGTEGATLGLAACASGQIYKYNGTAWACAADDSGTGSGTVSSGIAGQLAYYAASGTTVSGTTALPDGTTATTQTAGDNSTKVATTAYVATAVAGAGGGNMSTSTWDVDSNGAIDLAKGGTNATTAADAATALGLGTTSAVTHASVTVTGPTTDAPTIKDLAVHNITSAGKSMMQIQPSFVPSQAFTGSLYGLLFIPSLGGTNSYTMGDVFGIYSRVDTGSGFSGILNSSNGVYIGNGSKGNAGAAVNSARGIWIANLSQGTANYGIQSDMAAGAGKWFLYGNGAAASFLAGGLQVGGTATDVGAGNIKADNFIISGYEEKTTSYTVSKDSSKITLASGTATVTLPASIPAGDVSVVVTVAGAAASGVSFAATGGSISWGDAGAPAFTNSKTADVVCHSQNTAATTTAAWRCVKGGNF